MIYVLIAAAVLSADLFAKAYVKNHAEELQDKMLFSGHAKIRLTYNRGFAGSRMEDRPNLVKWAGIAGLAACAVCFIVSLRTESSKVLKAALAVAFGGVLGNAWERIRRGKVTDFLCFLKKGKPAGYIFNLADLGILIGGIAALAAMFAGLKHK